MIEFQAFPKIPRYRRNVRISEKLDGTNAAVAWVPWSLENESDPNVILWKELADQHGVSVGMHALLAQSRQRFITPARVKPKNDNYGFAQWVDANAQELTKLGPGYHYGEWWGYGIQRGYGLPEKRFSLFNVSRWGDDNPNLPACCHVVPLLADCLPSQIEQHVEDLRLNGSKASPGYMRPEGVVVWHTQSKSYYKILLDGDDQPKGKRE
jgi:hypothetical protein